MLQVEILRAYGQVAPQLLDFSSLYILQLLALDFFNFLLSLTNLQIWTFQFTFCVLTNFQPPPGGRRLVYHTPVDISLFHTCRRLYCTTECYFPKKVTPPPQRRWQKLLGSNKACDQCKSDMFLSL